MAWNEKNGDMQGRNGRRGDEGEPERGIDPSMAARWRELLELLYGAEQAPETTKALESLVNRYRDVHRPAFASKGFTVDERDAVLVIRSHSPEGEASSDTQGVMSFAAEELGEVATMVHVLSPRSSSCRDAVPGFDESVAHLKEIGELSDPRDVDRTARESGEEGGEEDADSTSSSVPDTETARLMADLNVNHCRATSVWFQRFVDGTEPYDRYFVTESPDAGLSAVFRPRPGPLLTPVETAHGVRHVWSTFGPGYADLDYRNPAVLLEVLDTLLAYATSGVRAIRLGSVAYVWKEAGTAGVHHPRTHAIVRLFRAVLDAVAPDVALVVQSDVPSHEPLSYFGEGDEANVVHQSALAGLLLDAFLREDATILANWARALPETPEGTTFLNQLGSPEGVPLTPVRGLLVEEQVAELAQVAERRGAEVVKRETAYGMVPDSLHGTFMDILVSPALPDDQRVRQLLVAHSVLLALRGIPALELSGLLAGAFDGEREKRSIGEEPPYHTLVTLLQEQDTAARRVFAELVRMLRIRGGYRAFHPSGRQRVLETPAQLVAIHRVPPERDSGLRATDGVAAGAEAPGGVAERPREERCTGQSPDTESRPKPEIPRSLVCIHNLTSNSAECMLSRRQLGFFEQYVFTDVLTGDRVLPYAEGSSHVSIEVEPYEILWLAFVPDAEEG